VVAETKAEAACRAKIVAGKLAQGTECRTETKTAAAIAKAQAKLRTTIANACGGKDKTCGAGGTDDVPLALLGWNVGVCPGIDGGTCAAPIDDCGGVITCVTCIGETLVARTLDVATGAFVPTNPKAQAEKPLNKCQAAIAKAVATQVAAKTVAQAKCWAAVNADKATGTCPAADGKAVDAIAKADAKQAAAICKACGGADKACGGDDDALPAAIGFVSTCPSVTPPGEASCAAPVSSLPDLVACVDCATEFAAACAADAAVPGLAAYPGTCRP
jgi:hypothetical protein